MTGLPAPMRFPGATRYAEVAVDFRSAPGKTFSYEIPLGVDVRPGHVVEVPFGSRRLPGFVFELTESPGFVETKEISRVVDVEPWLSEVQLQLARWLSVTYLSSLYSAAALMVPPGFRQRVQAAYTAAAEPPQTSLNSLDEPQEEVFRFLQEQGSADEPSLLKRFGKKNAEVVLGQLVRKRLAIRKWVWLKPRVKARLVAQAELAIGREAALVEASHLETTVAMKQAARLRVLRSTRAAKLAVLLRSLATTPDGSESVEELLARSGSTKAVLKALERAGLVKRSGRLATQTELAIDRELAIAEADRFDSTRVVKEAALQRNSERDGAIRQAALLRALAAAPDGAEDISLLLARASATAATLKALEKAGFAQRSVRRSSRDPLAGRRYPETQPLALTPAQECAWDEVHRSLMGAAGSPRVFLLHGVTGSGKTELYLRALAQVVAQGGRGIVLVPEISLTPQTIERFSGRFPGGVAVLHSRLTPGQQFDEWWRIRQAEADVVIGSRGAVFAPQPNLRLIVLDEEHEWTYKQQDPSPRYHSRDVAVKLADLTGAIVLLGSATPQIESYAKARSGEYRLLRLPERIAATPGRHGPPGLHGDQGDGVAGSAPLPTVHLVDLRAELKSGNRTVFSRMLRSGITKTLERKEQVILFLNRRGAANFVQCRDCGHVIKCRRCSTPMTYHAEDSHLRCHQCNYRVPAPMTCPECWGSHVRYVGMGTEALEVEVVKAFADAVTIRWDSDVTQGPGSHEEILRKFLAREADILIGTQMIAKGLHLPGVTLVGVVNADIGLFSPDFRASERVFQVLCQVAGRSGRGEERGTVIVQTYSPEHYAIQAASRQDFEGFFEDELGRRMEMGMPPYNKLARLVYAHPNPVAARREAERIGAALQERMDQWGFPDTKLIGPAPAPFERIRGRYRWHLMVQGPNPLMPLDNMPLPEGWTVDVDPVQLT